MPYTKYHSKPVVIDGIKFDSQKEAGRYKQLRMWEEEGKISNLERQVPFLLVPKQMLEHPRRNLHKTGLVNCEREIKYLADFVYYRDGVKIVEDVKGLKTPEYIIKRKLMKFFHNIEINEV